MKNNDGFVMVFSVANSKSFEEVDDFYQQILRVKDTEDFPMILVANKIDLVDQREVEEAKYSAYCSQNRIRFLNASAMKRINIDESFFELVKEMRRLLAEETNLEMEPSVQKSSTALIQTQSHAFSNLTQSLRALHAKMYILREDLGRSMKDDTALDINTASESYEALGRDLSSLMEEWHTGKQLFGSKDIPSDSILKTTETEFTSSSSPSVPPFFSDRASTGADMSQGTSIPEEEDDFISKINSKRDSCGDWGPRFYGDSPINSRPLGFLMEEEEPTSHKDPRPSREERIQIAKKERVLDEARRRERDTGHLMVQELKQVLVKRL